MLLSPTVREPLANTYIAIWYRTHFPIQFLPVALVKHLVRSIFFNYAERGHIPLSLEGEIEVLRTGLIPRSQATLKCIGAIGYRRRICRINGQEACWGIVVRRHTLTYRKNSNMMC